MKKVLFLCVENSCRSQMAEAFMKHYAGGVVVPFSAGSRPSGKVNAMAVKVMGEEGIDISGAVSKGLKDLREIRFDISVSMGCGDICPVAMSGEHLEWSIEDPKGKDIEVFRMVRDQIKDKVKILLDEIMKEKGDNPDEKAL